MEAYQASGEAPAAYSIDVALQIPSVARPSDRLVEVNDGYAQMVEVWWREMARPADRTV